MCVCVSKVLSSIYSSFLSSKIAHEALETFLSINILEAKVSFYILASYKEACGFGAMLVTKTINYQLLNINCYHCVLLIKQSQVISHLINHIIIKNYRSVTNTGR